MSWHTVLFANSHVSSHRTIAPGGAAGDGSGKVSGEGSGKVSGEGSGEGSGEDGALVAGAGVVATTLGVTRAASRAIRIDWPGFIVVRGLIARSFGMLFDLRSSDGGERRTIGEAPKSRARRVGRGCAGILWVREGRRRVLWLSARR